MSALDPVWRLGWKAWYQALALYSQAQGARFSVMNWGYDDGRALVPIDLEERWPLQLYARVVEGVALGQRSVVDVSCGRGGGLAFLAQTHGARARGIDFTPGNIALCRQAFDGIAEWQVGSALALPLPDRSVDVVVSIEASHCYQRLDRFVDEAARVLRDDGVLCWTDFCPRADLDAHRALCATRFGEVTDVDVTPHVLAAMKADGARRRAIIRKHSLRALWPVFDNFAAADDDNDTVRRFREGRSVYFLRQLRRPRR